MIGLLHYMTFLPGPAEGLVAALSGSSDLWLGGTPLDADRRLLALRPDGLLPDPEELVEVLVTVGPVAKTASGALRRLSFQIADGAHVHEALSAPPVRCDLEIRPARASGCRLHLRGEWRPALDADEGRESAEVIDALTRPLVENIAIRVTGSTLQV